jgi:hypothetical protein
MYEPPGNVGLRDVEAAIEYDEIGNGAFGDGAEIFQLQLGGRSRRTELHSVRKSQADVANQKFEYTIHRRDAAGQRAVFEIRG